MNRRRFLRQRQQRSRSCQRCGRGCSRRHGLRGQFRSISRVRPGDSGVAVRSELGPAQPGCRGAARQGAVAARGVPGSAIEPRLRACVQGIEEPLLPRRRDRADAIPRLGRCLDVAAKRLRRDRPDDRRCRGGRQFRPREQSATRREGWRPQLPGHLECGRLFADLDTKNECRHLARRIHRCRVRRTTSARNRRSRSKRVRSGGRSMTPSRRREAATFRAADA